MTDNQAILAGYTEEYIGHISNTDQDTIILVKPMTDFNRKFFAWNTDTQHFMRVDGRTDNRWEKV